jgi:FKBP-type peptidyl-prolyl cis-trans isomerase FklB
MKLRWFAGLGIVIAFCACQIGAQETPALKDQKDKVSYSIGMEIGKNLKKGPFEVNQDFLLKGIKDAFSGEKPLMTDQEITEVMTAFQKEIMAKQQEMQKKLGEKNKAEGEAFLAENKKKEGVKTLPSGLQYKVIKAGAGKKPKATDTVTVQYRGSLVNGTEFDSSYKRGTPATFPVTGVIPGWTEVLQLMEVGAKWEVVIPSNLAYGERSAGAQIGPNSTLIFEVELISVQEAK